MDAISRCAQAKATIESLECIRCMFAACICDSPIVDGAIAVEFELVDLGDRGRDKSTAEQTNARGPPLSGALPEAQPFVVVLQQPLDASRGQPCRLQRGGIQEVGLQPAQLGPIGAVQLAGVGDGLGAEVETDGLKPQLGQQACLMASAAARHHHPPGWQGTTGIGPQKVLQRWRLPAQLPAVAALAVALVPAGCLSANLNRLCAGLSPWR